MRIDAGDRNTLTAEGVDRLSEWAAAEHGRCGDDALDGLVRSRLDQEARSLTKEEAGAVALSAVAEGEDLLKAGMGDLIENHVLSSGQRGLTLRAHAGGYRREKRKRPVQAYA